MKKSIIILGAILVSVNAATASNQKLVTKNAIEFSVNPNSPLHIAISKGDLESVKKFIQYGADVNKISKDMSPLMVAARYNKCEIIMILLANGAKPSEKNEKGFTAFNYAEFSNATDCIAILKDLK